MEEKQALLLLSGQLLDGFINKKTIYHLKTLLSKELKERNAFLTRQIVILSPERFRFAELFLEADFEIIPCDHENIEIISQSIIFMDKNQLPDEIIFGFGFENPKRLLRHLTGKVPRTILIKNKLAEPILSHSINFEHIINIESCFVKDESQVQQGAFYEKAKITSNDVQVSISAENDYQSENEQNIPSWGKALEDLVLNHNKKMPVLSAVAILQTEYPDLLQLYQTNKERLRTVLPSSIRWIHENKESLLYHETHSDLKPVSAKKAKQILTFNSVFEETSNSDDEKMPGVTEQTFKDIAIRSDIMRQQCLWSIDRIQLVNSGANHQEVIYPKDQELEQLGKDFGVFLWPIRHQLTPEQYQTMADCYQGLNISFELLHSLTSPENDIFNNRFSHKAAQIAADAQCLVKSGLQEFGLSLGIDAIQRDAFQLLLDYGRKNEIFFRNMKLTDTLNLSLITEIQPRCETLKEDFQQAKKTIKSMKNLERQFDFHVKKHSTIPEGNRAEIIHNWNKIIEAVTGLCETFKIPNSSLLFRKRLENLINQIPDEVMTTTAFAHVVQQIELYQQQQEEEFLLEPVETDLFSPAVQAIRDRYQGAKALFIGGTPQDHLKQRIESKLDIQLIWSETDHGNSLERFASLLHDDEVRLFLIYIPWCSHKHSEEFAAWAKKAEKDFVRLRKGTNPEQIALAICQQLKINFEEA